MQQRDDMELFSYDYNGHKYYYRILDSDIKYRNNKYYFYVSVSKDCESGSYELFNFHVDSEEIDSAHFVLRQKIKQKADELLNNNREWGQSA